MTVAFGNGKQKSLEPKRDVQVMGIIKHTKTKKKCILPNIFKIFDQ
jgi:hypothetical protein